MTFHWSSWPYLSAHPFSELCFCLCILSSRLAGCPYIILSLRMPCVKSYFQDSYWSVIPLLLFQCWSPWWQVGSVCFWLLGAATWPLPFHAPFILIAIRQPNSEAVSAIIHPDLQRKTVSQLFTACDSFPSTFFITFIVLWAIPRKMFSWYFFLVLSNRHILVSSLLWASGILPPWLSCFIWYPSFVEGGPLLCPSS